MSKVLAWIRSILCFLCFFQVFLQLTPKESYRKYLKFFGNLILVLLLLRPGLSSGAGGVFGAVFEISDLKQ